MNCYQIEEQGEKPMEALVIHAPGDLRVEEVPTPALEAGQLLVRVRCGGICGSDLHYYGSAMRTPHVQGAFRQQIVVEQWQAHRLADSVSDGEGSMAEPLSVALHAVRRAGSLLGKRVLVTGCGPIGALAIIAARR